jgi:hypothetical protein
VRLLLAILFTFAFAATGGLTATWLAVTRGFGLGGVTSGAWTAHPKSGTTDIDPYARAFIARTGALPLGSGDGVAFIARTDDGGKPLDGRCDLVIAGLTPQARYWTLTLYDPEGRLVANVVGRHGFTSQEIVRRADGSFEIVAASRARAGNWIPTGGVERYILMLRLYDTAVGIATRAGRETAMPSLRSGACA